MTRVLALVPARDETARIGDTVRAIRSLPSVEDVVVVDDGSTDDTATEARLAGARVLVAPRPLGKGRAMEEALDRAGPADVYLFLDADLGPSAKEAQELLDQVAGGRADLAIGVLPPQPGHGGLGVVQAVAGQVIRLLCRFGARAPLSGQRAVTAAVIRSVRPLARGFGLEVGMTVDAVRLGFRVREVPVRMEHVPTGRDAAGFVHRTRQGLDVLAAAWPRLLGLR